MLNYPKMAAKSGQSSTKLWLSLIDKQRVHSFSLNKFLQTIKTECMKNEHPDA